MATYNLDTVAGALVQETMKRLYGAYRSERHYNVKAVPGLAVGDVLYFDTEIPEWARTLVVSKRSDTTNPDVVTAQTVDPALPIAAVLPIKTANTVQTTGSTSSTNSNTILMQLYPVGNKVRVQITIASTVPNQMLLSLLMYDA
ncbi:hypothetical protein ACJBUE_12755 [Ralstonia syzygii subsp. celebesensis]|uniref:Uncharacterized protein n=2 Tax=Ralstonia syzygii subsp. celebesensis TaxID=1310168 RepID=A0A1U9VDB8_9RALS|nr:MULTISPECIES: hypothetical protein [Burkholderiaceae]AQW28648.1 hypothetical protein B0B51_00485 [blood disease bacterium A2-HR MARDI]CCA82215.1 hypothetical protein BDB_30032 [blood disease bacterium R229]